MKRTQIILVVSDNVLEDTRRNLAGLKEPKDAKLEQLLSSVNVEIVTVDRNQVLRAADIVVLKDVPIIAAAKKAKITMLASLDRKHILNHPELESYVNAPILTPAKAFQKTKASE